MYGNGFGTGFMYLVIAQILFFIVTVGLIIWLVRIISQEKNARTILNNRLASGKITKDEYNQLLSIITNSEVDIK